MRRRPHASRHLADDPQRQTLTLDSLHRREQSPVEIGAARRPAANGLLDERHRCECRREFEHFCVRATVGFDPPDTQSVFERIEFARNSSSDHGCSKCNGRSMAGA